MNRHIIKGLSKVSFIIVILSVIFTFSGCDHHTFDTKFSGTVEGKALYHPKEFLGQDWSEDTNDYSYKRMALTDNFAIYWEKGFGNDLSDPPLLNGNSMKVDLSNMKDKLETFYAYYRDKLQFVKSGSLSEKYRMMVMLQYSLDGTAYGGAYDDTIGAFWAAPNRLQDTKLNTVAHELGHSFQNQLIADGQGTGWGHGVGCAGGFYEMTSQWMLWQVNPDWVTDENYHWDAFKSLTYRAFLHTDNIYHSPYVLEYWSQKHGLPFIADMFRQGVAGEDPVQTYKKMNNMNQEQFVDEMFDCYQHLVNLDYSRVYSETRQWANSFYNFKDSMIALNDGWFQVKANCCPENYGFNIIKLNVPEVGDSVKVDFYGLQGASGKADGYTNEWWHYPDYRYGFVCITQDGSSIIGKVNKADYNNQASTATFTAPLDKKLQYLWLVVMGAPSEHCTLDQLPLVQWPYRIKITGSEIL